MDGLSQDLRLGLRNVRRRPAFSLVVVVTLALGIGAVTAIFSAVDALLLRPLPVAAVDRLVYGMALREGFDPFATSLLDYELYRTSARSLESCGLGSPRSFTLLGRGDAEHLRGAAVTASYLATLGVRPALGRLFSEVEDRPGGPAVALVGHGLWQRRFGGDRSLLGRTLDLEGRAHTVIGILPPAFDLPYSAEVWVPFQSRGAALPLDERALTAHELVARLAPGATLDEARRELRTLAARLEREHPAIRRGWSYGIVPLRRQLLADLDGRTERSLVALGVGVGLLLLLCCANVAGLLLARGMTRQGELATRLALGAPRRRLARQLLVESLLLAAMGGAAGVGLAAAAAPLLAALSPIQASGLGPLLTDFRLDGRVLAAAAAVTIVAAALAGSAPALGLTRAASLGAALASAGRRATGRGTRRSLSLLVIAEVALSAVLLVGGTLTAGSFQRLQRLDLGFRPDGLVAFELPLSATRYPGPAERTAFLERVLERVRALPGVAEAGVTINLPMQRGTTFDSVFEAEGRPPVSPDQVPITAHRLVLPGYLETLGVTLQSGRLLEPGDRAGSLPVAVVSEELARQAWPGRLALGRRVRRLRAGVPGPWMTVVGVVADVKEDRFGFRVDRPVWYVPYDQETFALPAQVPFEMVVRGSRRGSGRDAGAGLARSIRQVVRQLDPAQPVGGAMPMREYLGDVLVGERFGAVLMNALACCGLLLAAVGLHGAMAWAVGQRTRELALRVAVGARPDELRRGVVRDGLALAGVGLAVGGVAAWALARLLAGGLFEARAADPAAYAATAAAIVAVSVVACAIPARRAARVDPMVALGRE